MKSSLFFSSLGTCLMLCLVLESGSGSTLPISRTMRLRGGGQSKTGTGLHRGFGSKKRPQAEESSLPDQNLKNSGQQSASRKMPTKEELFQLSTQLFSPKSSLGQKNLFKVCSNLPSGISGFQGVQTCHMHAPSPSSHPWDARPPYLRRLSCRSCMTRRLFLKHVQQALTSDLARTLKVLGVSRTATPKEIREAYYRCPSTSSLVHV
jgi:hypothetical protein